MCRSATTCSADDHQEAEVRPGSLKAGIKGAHTGMVLMPLLFPLTMPAARLSRRRKVVPRTLSSCYAICVGEAPTNEVQSRLLNPRLRHLPATVSFAPNVTPVTYVDTDDTGGDLSLDSEGGSPTASLFPPSATPAPPPTRKRCPPGKRRSQDTSRARPTHSCSSVPTSGAKSTSGIHRDEPWESLQDHRCVSHRTAALCRRALIPSFHHL